MNSLPVIQSYCFEIRVYPDAKNRAKAAVELDAKRLLGFQTYITRWYCDPRGSRRKARIL